MKKALISRYGAYGDIIHMSHLPRLLAEDGYVVDVETNYKGLQLLTNNPYINNIIFFEPQNHLSLYQNPFWTNKHWEIVSQGYDKFINLFGSIELSLLSAENSNLQFMHQKNRDVSKNINYYDRSTILAGYEDKAGTTGEVYYTEEEYRIVKKFLSKINDPIMINASGTTLNKRLVIGKQLVSRLLEEYPQSDILITGDSSDEYKDIQTDRILFINKMPFRQVLLIAKYVRVFIGMESGLAVGANMWKTPTVQLMTAASLVNHPNGCKNDFSLQSEAYCSPCLKAQYRFLGCPHKDGYPLCVWFDIDKVMEQVRKAYDAQSRDIEVPKENVAELSLV